MRPPPRDAWTLRRLLCGHSINGELADVTQSFRPVADKMAESPLEDREGIFDDYLIGHADREDIIRAVADQDALGPAPPIEASDPADEWGPIRLGILPPAEPFPLDSLCLPAQHLAGAAAKSIGCSVDFPAVAMLAAASGLIGRSVNLLIKPGYFASASLYVALVGSPSSGKSPALRAALAPVLSISEKIHQQWRPKMDDWKSAKAGERGEEPSLQRLVSTDPTTEALGPILAKNPRGLIVAPDEMTRWVMSMDQYKNGKGGDRPFYLSTWNGEPIFIDRAKHMREPIVVPHPFLTVVGGLTPDMLSALPEGQGRDDGFIARLLFAYPDRVKRRYSEEGIPDDVANEWARVAEALWSLGMQEVEGKPFPRVVRMNHGAGEQWRAWCQAHYAEQEADDFRDSMEGPWGKLEAYTARLALILHLMDLMSDPTRPKSDDLPDLPRRTIEAAFRLVAYFKSHALRVYAAMGGKADDGGDDVRSLVRWIRRHELTEFAERDITRNMRRLRDDPAAMEDALDWMISHNIIKPRQRPEASPKVGRPHSAIYDVNPQLKKRTAKAAKLTKLLRRSRHVRGFGGIGNFAAPPWNGRDRPIWHSERTPEVTGSTGKRSETRSIWPTSRPDCLARPRAAGVRVAAASGGIAPSMRITTRHSVSTPTAVIGDAGVAVRREMSSSWFGD